MQRLAAQMFHLNRQRSERSPGVSTSILMSLPFDQNLQKMRLNLKFTYPITWTPHQEVIIICHYQVSFFSCLLDGEANSEVHDLFGFRNKQHWTCLFFWASESLPPTDCDKLVTAKGELSRTSGTWSILCLCKWQEGRHDKWRLTNLEIPSSLTHIDRPTSRIQRSATLFMSVPVQTAFTKLGVCLFQ